MKKFFFFLTACFMLSCSSDSSSGTSTDSLKLNNTSYDFNKIYVTKMNGAYSVALTKGDLTMDFTVPNTPTVTYSSNFSRALVFTISASSSLPIGTHSFAVLPASQPVTTDDNIIFFRDEYQISNGNIVSYNTLFDYTDNSSTQSRVVITKSANDFYTFDFNVITTAGLLTGTYSGVIIKTNY